MTLDDYLIDDYTRGRRPQARHRAPGRPRTGLRARAAATLHTARQTARDALRDALVGSGTPAGGLALHASLNRAERTS